MEYLFPPDMWRMITEYLLNFRETHRRQSRDVRKELCLRSPLERDHICVYSKFPPFPFYVFRDRTFQLYSLTHHLEKCSNYAQQWQPLRVWSEFVRMKDSACPYSHEHIQSRWNAYRLLSEE
jgi:hypothetical protein